MSNEGQLAGNTNLQKQDLSQLDISKLTPLSPEVISRQATINIGTIGHVAHGKSTVVKAISGVHTVRFKNELERNITIKLERIPDDKMLLLTTSPNKLREFIAEQQSKIQQKAIEFCRIESKAKKTFTSKLPSTPTQMKLKRKRREEESPNDKFRQISILNYFQQLKRPNIECTESSVSTIDANESNDLAESDTEECNDELHLTSSNTTEKEEVVNDKSQQKKKNINHTENIDHANSDTESTCSSVISNIRRLNELNGSSSSTKQRRRRQQQQQQQQIMKRDLNTDEYIVASIRELNEIDYKPHFLVRWKGYPASDNTWEPLNNVRNCDMLNDFLNKLHDRYNSTINQLAAEFQNKSIRPISIEAAFKLLKKFDEIQLRSDLILLAQLKSQNDDNEKSYQVILKRIEANIDLLPYYIKRQEQLEQLNEWETSINSTDKSSNLTIENIVDFEGPPDNFQYINDNVCADGIVIPDDPIIGCECGDVCNFRNECCGIKSGSTFAYNKKKRVKVPPGTPIFECNKRCKCGPNCMNRVVQQGRKHSLCIFKTDNCRGWGVRTERIIYEGQFICEYVGEIISYDETERRGQIYDAQGRTYLFDLDMNRTDNPYSIDSAVMGNVSHFINHSCDPNCGVWAVWINCLDMDLPKICLFALRRIEAGEELCFDYLNPKANGLATTDVDVADSSSQSCDESPKKMAKRVLPNLENMKCKCGSVNCRKYIF